MATTYRPPMLNGKPVSEFFADSENASEFEAHWDKLWKMKFTPWDRGCPSMPLNDILRDNPELLTPSLATGTTEEGTRPKALVPGAGRGHDVLLLASYGFDTWGLDLSPEAAAGARENEASSKDLEVYKTKGARHGKVTWLTGNYFTYDFSHIGKFDLIFDYTFLCALPLELRPKWSRSMRNNLAPNGKLVCLEFPTTKPTIIPGPPFALPPVVYETILARPGEEIPYNDENGVDVSKLGPESPDRLVRLMRITPRETFWDGYDEDNNVIDRVSVWCHRKSQE